MKTKSRAWKAFLPIPTPSKQTAAPAVDPAWLIAKGIEPEAPLLLEVVHKHVLPLLKLPHLDGLHFLVHTRTEGVPAPSEDSRAFVDLSLYFKRPVDPHARLHQLWLWVQPRGGDQTVTPFIRLLNEQTAVYLRLVEHCTSEAKEEMALLHVRQRLHYWANMAQMRIQ